LRYANDDLDFQALKAMLRIALQPLAITSLAILPMEIASAAQSPSPRREAG
jgi:hypothetical protein